MTTFHLPSQILCSQPILASALLLLCRESLTIVTGFYCCAPFLDTIIYPLTLIHCFSTLIKINFQINFQETLFPTFSSSTIFEASSTTQDFLRHEAPEQFRSSPCFSRRLSRNQNLRLFLLRQYYHGRLEAKRRWQLDVDTSCFESRLRS